MQTIVPKVEEVEEEDRLRHGAFSADPLHPGVSAEHQQLPVPQGQSVTVETSGFVINASDGNDTDGVQVCASSLQLNLNKRGSQGELD